MSEQMSTEIITLTCHVLNSQARTPQASGDLTILLTTIQTTCKFICCDRIGAAGITNVQGEEQKKLDVLSNDIMINSLQASGKVALMVSEENIIIRTYSETKLREKN
ncbi:hypothetical protein MJO28_001309 [Puccinia striiformis f. sp. tritici]|uniref:Uncharacterized protein n=1 Tax=Puccinia striiformis f. sp. tritici TaxID=168172 RepID=A0ACC0EVE3_9BASI|nr:hypothetical protein Pst134EB_004500 [Puccinia striiformis f. sp. tritici]KAI7960820.1 hypothetical protein MJO28_001309 [Puccinia striiformis f. sp. tritici]KAI7965567.1 hypothetical protein MJO29_001315 [Puccinia striiformis f. sp. tritici]